MHSSCLYTRINDTNKFISECRGKKVDRQKECGLVIAAVVLDFMTLIFVRSGTTVTTSAGPLRLQPNGEKLSDSSVMQVAEPVTSNEDFRLIVVSAYAAQDDTFSESNNFHWIGGSPPNDVPPCGFSDPYCCKFPVIWIISCAFKT